MKIRSAFFPLILTAGALAFPACAQQPDAVVPASAPRTNIVAGKHDAFRAYLTKGEGAAAFAIIKRDFDARCFDLPFPDEPLTYGDPSPSKRDSAKADLWRGAQDICGRISAVAETGAMIWIATGEQRYLDKAKEYILRSIEWSLDGSGWENGPKTGTTAIEYNDEAHFRLWRKLPLVYDQIRDQFTAAERARIIAHFRQRGMDSVEWIKQTGRIETLKRNSLEVTPSSHPVRFMPMTALTGLALWDEIPEAREWWRFAYGFYRDQFTPFGGDDGGWAEGVAYWRGIIEHAAYQDALFAIGDKTAYNTPFWKNTPYFQIYNVQPYRHTAFGDLSNAGKFNLEPVVAEFLQHVARVTGDGHLVSYAALLTDERPSPAEAGLGNLDRIYPTAVEFLFRNFIASSRPMPAPAPLSALPSTRFFSDVGWVSMHSALGQPAEDIHVTFLSSPFGSFSHSHAHQNAFILNAWGENLAISSSYREFHNSPHHEGWTRQTVSKNAVLIDGKGQKSGDKTSVGKITRFAQDARSTWSTGDATIAYQKGNPGGGIERATRDLIFIDQRYVITRDVVRTTRPSTLTWLLHAERTIGWDNAAGTALIRNPGASLSAHLVSPTSSGWTGRVEDKFPIPVDPKYVQGSALNYWVTGTWDELSHLYVDTARLAQEHVVFAVLWPERGGAPGKPIEATLEGRDTLVIRRPDGRTDRVTLTDTAFSLR